MTKGLSIFASTENQVSRISQTEKIAVELLVFTRFESERLDYKFYFASSDKDLTETVKQNLIPENDEGLPYQAFFIYKKYCILTVAELWMSSENKVRKDNVGRNISRRLFFIWNLAKQPDWLNYEHLLVLYENLRQATTSYVDTVPNENKEIDFKPYSFDFDRSILEDAWAKISVNYKEDYGKFLLPNLQDVKSQTINITTPNNWTFEQQILLLKGLSINKAPYFIWHKVFNKISPKYENLIADNRWITSDDKEGVIGLYNSERGNLINKIEIYEELNRSANVNVFEEITNSAIESDIEIDKEKNIPDKIEEINEVITQEHIDKAKLSEFQPTYTYEVCDLEITNNVDFLKREISFFLCSDSKFNSPIFDSWNNLLNEIRVHYARASKKQKHEWLRRLDAIRIILDEEIKLNELNENDRYSYESSFLNLTNRLLELVEHD